MARSRRRNGYVEFSAIVETATDLLAIRIADRFHGIGAQPIGDNLLHDPLEKLQRRGLCQGNAAHCDVSYPIRATEPAVHQGRLQRGFDRSSFDQPRPACHDDLLQQGDLILPDPHMIATELHDGFRRRHGISQTGARVFRDQRIVMSLQHQELAQNWARCRVGCRGRSRRSMAEARIGRTQPGLMCGLAATSSPNGAPP